MNNQHVFISNKNHLKNFSLFGVLALVLLPYVAQAQLPAANSPRGTQIINVDPSFQEFSVGGFTVTNSAEPLCVSGTICRYGVDVEFLNPQISGGNLTFSIGIRAHQDLPVSGSDINVNNLGNLFDGYIFAVYYDGVDLTGCTSSSNPAVSAAFSGVTANIASGNVQSFAQAAGYRAFGPGSAIFGANEVYLNSDDFTPIVDVSCDISGVDVDSNPYANLIFSANAYPTITQLYATNMFFAYAARYTNSLEFFPLDGTSAYIEEARLADTNRHAFIKFNEDLPDDLVLSASMFSASHDSYGNDGLFVSFSSASTIEATSVAKIASDTVWVTFPETLATEIASRRGLLQDILLDFQPGTDGFIDTVFGGEKRALARVSAQYGLFSNGLGGSISPPRIDTMVFNNARDALTVTFDQAVSSLSTGEAITSLTADDFELLYWDGENSEKVDIIEISQIVAATSFELTLQASVVTKAANATNPVYFQLRTNPASPSASPSDDASQNQFYITTATVFSAAPLRQVARTLPAPGVSGNYGIGMRDIPGNALIRFPELNVAPTITPSLAVILAEDVDASNPMRMALLSSAGAGSMNLMIADGNDDGSVLPDAAMLTLTWGSLPANFQAPGNLLGVIDATLVTSVGDASGGSITIDVGGRTFTEVNTYLTGIQFTYGDFTGAANFTLTFNDGGNAPVGAAMEASAQIVVTKDQIPPTIGSGGVSAFVTGTSATISWTAATDQAGALDASGNPASGATSNNQIGYTITITDMSGDIGARTSASTTQELSIPVGELTGPGLLEYTLNRSNTVLIPGRSYMVRITAMDSAGLRSVGQNTGMIEMGPSRDLNNNGIEDSIEAAGVVSDIASYCGGSASVDSDNDGISNGRELEIGTDCRPAGLSNNNFTDSGLTIDGVNDLMLVLTKIGTEDIADVYTVSNPVAGIGLTKIERGSLATVTCPSDNAECATIRPLLVVDSADVCMNNLGGEEDTDLVMPAGVSGTLCQVQDEDNIYLPVGFSEVIWKVQDSFGNVLISSSNNNLRQLYYVAPEISVSPRKHYVQLNESGGINGTNLVATVNVNFGAVSRYTDSFGRDISESIFSFMLDLSSEEGTIDPNGSYSGWNSANGVSTLEYAYAVSAIDPVVDPGVLATLLLDISGVRTIDSAGDAQLMIDRQDPNTYAYKIGNTEQEIEVIERIIPAPTISFVRLSSGSSSGTLTIMNNDSKDRMILISLFDSSSDMEVDEEIFSSISGVISAGASSPISIAIRTPSESLAMRIRILASEGEVGGDPLYERYCYNSSNGFCNTSGTNSTRSNYSTSTSPSRTASVELISQLSHRPEGRYAANLVLDSNTSPEMKAMTDTGRFGNYGQFPSITFNVNSVNDRVFSPMIAVVVALSEVLPEDDGYMHKYINLQWQAFVEQDADGVEHGRLYSAKSTSGSCPTLVSPGDVGGLSTTSGDSATNGDWSDIINTETQSVLWYRTTRGTSNLDSLRAGDDCVLMWIADGGANDADGVRNGIVSDPSRIGAPADGSVATGRRGGGGGGGAVNTGLLFLLMLIAGAALIQRRKVVAKSNL
ncbi:MAG: thrombospondin type 3 repeat-containing protein [Candidatus Oxydemutatoraceae bacterium WSBS_2016_MAG_OTU14]